MKSQSALILRPATTIDGPFISHLVIDGWRDSYGGFLPASLLAGLDANPHHDVEAWRARLADPSARTWVVVADGAEAGVARIDLASSIAGTAAELTTLYIAAPWRGRGLGGDALGFVQSEAARLEVLPLGIGVLSGNVRGRRFYERHGARVIGERPAFEWDGQVVIETMHVVAE